MKLTAAIIQECIEREKQWCAMPRTRAEERDVITLLEGMNRIVVPNPASLPRDVQVLIEQAELGATADTPPTGAWTPSGPRSFTHPNGDIHERMAAAFRGTGPAPGRVLAEHRDGARDVTSLTAEERYSLLHQLATGEASLVLPRLRSVLTEHRDEEPSLPAGSHQKLAAALRGAAVEIPEGTHEKLGRAFGR